MTCDAPPSSRSRQPLPDRLHADLLLSVIQAARVHRGRKIGGPRNRTIEADAGHVCQSLGACRDLAEAGT
jgi:hypothetical protein